MRTQTPIAVRPPGLVLVDETDPTVRLAAHLELGRRALSRDDLDTAEIHFSEAHDLDPTDERPRAELRGLGRVKAQKSSRFKSWLRR